MWSDGCWCHTKFQCHKLPLFRKFNSPQCLELACQPKAKRWDFRRHMITKTEQWKSRQTLPLPTNLIFCCNMLISRSEFGINSVDSLICPSLHPISLVMLFPWQRMSNIWELDSSFRPLQWSAQSPDRPRIGWGGTGWRHESLAKTIYRSHTMLLSWHGPKSLNVSTCLRKGPTSTTSLYIETRPPLLSL